MDTEANEEPPPLPLRREEVLLLARWAVSEMVSRGTHTSQNQELEMLGQVMTSALSGDGQTPPPPPTTRDQAAVD